MAAVSWKAFGALAVLALLAGPAAAQDSLEKQYELGQRIGKGTFKSFYEVKGHPDLVLGIVERTVDSPLGEDEDDPEVARQLPLDQEKALLDRLEAKGLPVAKILSIGTWDGKPAYVQKRFAASDRDPDFYTKKRWELLNENSIADLETIERVFKKSRIDVADLQFLIAKDGHVAIADPMKITRRTSINDADEVLPTLLNWSREAIAARATKAALAKMPGAKEDKLAPFFGETAVEAKDAAAKSKLVDALALYLDTGPTTDAAKAAAQALRGGKLGLDGVALDRTFPEIAAAVVRASLAGSDATAALRDFVAKKDFASDLAAKVVPPPPAPSPAELRPATRPTSPGLTRALERATERDRADAR